MSYKSAILGCGPRAESHAAAYRENLDQIRLQAVCDMDRARLDALGERFGVARRYEELEEMLARETPDILHIVTMPQFREQPIEMAARHGVKGIIVEKPLGLLPSQVEKIKRIVQRTGIKIALNTQRRYFPTCVALRKALEDERIGEIRFVRVVTRGNILSMGPHMVDLLLYFLGDKQPLRVWACANGMSGHEWKHPAPANMLIRFIFPGNLVAYCEDAHDCVGVPEVTDYWQQFELDFWGFKGRAWWTQDHNWGYITDGMAKPYVEPNKWEANEALGQREFTRAMAHWLDGGATHRNCFENALRGFDMIMAALRSAYTNKDVPFPCPVADDTVKSLEANLTAEASGNGLGISHSV